MRLNKNVLKMRQALPLDVKIAMTQRRISEFVDYYGEEGVYVSFSGGKDSTVLLHLARELYPNLKAVFCDTWMEYPQLRSFVRSFENVDTVKPAMSMKEIIKECGWCFPSKDVADMIDGVRRDLPWAKRKLNGLNTDGTPSAFRERYKKWWPLVDAPFKVTAGCCLKQKEEPVAVYEKETGRKPMIAVMADESDRRAESYLRTGCNTFDTRMKLDKSSGCEEEVENLRPMSKPLGFWTERDILNYLYDRKMSIAPPYGEIVLEGCVEGQMTIFDVQSVPCSGCPMTTTGEKRTGCLFCPIGCHLDGFLKFRNLREYYPKLYAYCMEELGEKEVLEWVKTHFAPSASF